MSLLYRTVLDVLHRTRIARASRGACQGAGVVFMLHRVLPRAEDRREDGKACRFSPNGGLAITPAFLDAAIALVKSQGFELIPLRDVPARLAAARGGERQRPFACFTLDDGYRDNREHAWPVFRRHDAPFTIFVAPAYADGESELWWEVLEEVIRHHDEVHTCGLPDMPAVLHTRSAAGKQAAWDALYPIIRYMDEFQQRDFILHFAKRHGLDAHEQCRRLIMNWNELREMAADPLCSIGAHTMHHRALARLDEEEARYEMAASRARLEEELGQPARTLAYPYGDPDSAGPREFRLARELGFEVALTTRKGHLFPEHAEHLTALPRLSLNGYYQHVRYLDVLLSGLPFWLYNRFHRLNVA